jgi:hypothetical protein
MVGDLGYQIPHLQLDNHRITYFIITGLLHNNDRTRVLIKVASLVPDSNGRRRRQLVADVVIQRKMMDPEDARIALPVEPCAEQ